MSEPVPALLSLWRLSIGAAALERRARRLVERFHVQRPLEAKNTKAPVAAGAGKGIEG